MIKNNIMQCEPEDYFRLAKKISSKLMKRSDVSDVLMIGGVNHPGISDLDIVIVANDLKEEYMYLDALGENKLEKHLLMHPPFIIPDYLLQYISDLFFLTSNYSLVNNIDMHIKEKLNTRVIEYYKCSSMLVHSYPRFYNVLSTFDLRDFLTFGYAVKHNYAHLKSLEPDFNSVTIEKYIADITEFRSYIVKDKPKNIIKDEFISLVNRGIEATELLIVELSDLIDKSDFISVNAPNMFYVKSSNVVYNFNKDNRVSKEVINGVSIFYYPEQLAFPFISSHENAYTKLKKKFTIGSGRYKLASNELEKYMEFMNIYDMYMKSVVSSNFKKSLTFEHVTSLWWKSYTLNYRYSGRIIINKLKFLNTWLKIYFYNLSK